MAVRSPLVVALTLIIPATLIVARPLVILRPLVITGTRFASMALFCRSALFMLRALGGLITLSALLALRVLIIVGAGLVGQAPIITLSLVVTWARAVSRALFGLCMPALARSLLFLRALSRLRPPLVTTSKLGGLRTVARGAILLRSRHRLRWRAVLAFPPIGAARRRPAVVIGTFLTPAGLLLTLAPVA